MRDPHLDRALAAASRRGRAAGACPDATVLAAYADGSLTADERADLELHAADCPACVETLSVLASLDEGEPARASRRWWAVAPVTRWGWLVPVATAVLVVAVWIRTERVTGPAPAGVTSKPSEAVAIASAPPVDSPRMKAITPPERRDQELTAMRAEPRAAAAPPAAGGRILEDKDEKKERDTIADNRAAEATAEFSAPATPRPSSAAPAPAQQLPAAPPLAAGAAAAAAKADALERTSENIVTGASKTARGSTVASLMKQHAAPLVVSVPGTTVRIRVANDRIERSLDGGTTWAIEWPGPVGALRVGLCPTTDVCWLGGDAGAVLRRELDGRWNARGIPDVASPVTAFASLDATSATATLADGRQFVTNDGGVHWQAIPANP